MRGCWVHDVLIAHFIGSSGPPDPGRGDGLIWRQLRSVFFVTLIPCALSHALCSACALVNAAVLGRLTCFGFGVDILITRDIRMVPAGCTGESSRVPGRMQRLRTCRTP